jgi:6-phosphogluconolactonase (cycloisomerase 2 family)
VSIKGDNFLSNTLPIQVRTTHLGRNQPISQCLSNPNGKGKEAQFLISHMHDSGKRLTILTVKEIQALYGLPQFTDEERATYFALDPEDLTLPFCGDSQKYSKSHLYVCKSQNNLM